MTASYILQRLVRVVVIMLVAALINAIREISEKTPNNQGGGSAGNMGNNGYIRPQIALGHGEMKTMKLQSGFSLWLLVVAGLVFFIATLFLFIVTVSGDWGIGVWIMLFLEFMLLLFFIAAAVFHYYMKKQVIRFSENCMVVCRPFKADDVIPWAMFGRVEIQAERCIVYDRYGQVRLKVTAGWENYGLFCQMAKRKIEENGGEAVWR